MQTFVYAAELTPDETDGGFVVTFVDFPEAIYNVPRNLDSELG